MGEIENTQSEASQFGLLVDLLGGADGSQSIYAQEARGQVQLVNSTQLPVDVGRDGDAAFEALGFVFGPVSASDPLFREASLPEGWMKRPTEHSMWSEIVDPLGRARGAVFYKAAFYDRRAFMRLESVDSYVSRCVYGTEAPVLDDAWATRDAVVAALDDIADDRRALIDEAWASEDDRAGCRRLIARAEALRDAL